LYIIITPSPLPSPTRGEGYTFPAHIAENPHFGYDRVMRKLFIVIFFVASCMSVHSSETDGKSLLKRGKHELDKKQFQSAIGHLSAAEREFPLLGDYALLWLSDAYHETNNHGESLKTVRALLKKYPDKFTKESLQNHIDDLLSRFQNRLLGDTLFRVGCDLQRKLGPDDRIVGAIKLAIEMNLPYQKILKVLVYGCHFRATGEDGKMLPSDIEFTRIYQTGIRKVLTQICGFDKSINRVVKREAQKMDQEIKVFWE